MGRVRTPSRTLRTPGAISPGPKLVGTPATTTHPPVDGRRDRFRTSPFSPKPAHGVFIVGDNAVSGMKTGTVTCTSGSAGQKPVLWWTLTDKGAAYGQVAVIASDGTAIHSIRGTGVVNGNPLR